MSSFKRIIFLILFLIPLVSFSETVFVTKTGHKYHVDQCKYLRNSKIRIDLIEAQRLGFTSCSICIINPQSQDTSMFQAGLINSLNRNKMIMVSLLTISSFGALIAIYLKRKKGRNLKRLETRPTITEFELEFLKTILKEKQEFDTYSLNDFLGLKDKSMDAQRKSRARFVKTLNEKLHLLHNAPESILRISSTTDKRIICYCINPLYKDVLKNTYLNEVV